MRLAEMSEGADIRRLAVDLILEGRLMVPRPTSRYAQAAPHFSRPHLGCFVSRQDEGANMMCVSCAAVCASRRQRERYGMQFLEGMPASGSVRVGASNAEPSMPSRT